MGGGRIFRGGCIFERLWYYKHFVIGVTISSSLNFDNVGKHANTSISACTAAVSFTSAHWASDLSQW